MSSNAQCYVLVLFHSVEETVEVGACGELTWPRGWTYYVGRARHGWPSRVKRFHTNFRNHWHVDYLVSADSCTLKGVFPVDWEASRECELAVELNLSPLGPGIGNSDCNTDCLTHLFHGETGPGELLSGLEFPVDYWIEFTEDRSQLREFG